MSSTGLAISNVVNVSVSLTPAAAANRNFGAMMGLGANDIIDVAERYRAYADLSSVAADYPVITAEYLAAALHFSQTPRPKIFYIARWAQLASKGRLNGGALATSAQDITNFTAITSGALELEIDSVPLSVTGLNFSSETNLNGVASVLQTAIAALSTGSTVKWDAPRSRFQITSGTTGTSSKVGFAQAPTPTGSITFATNPANNDTITLGTTTVTFKTSGATGNQLNIAGSLAATLTALAAMLNASADAQISQASYSVSATKLFVEFKTTGTSGNSFALAASAATASGSTLSGGTGTNVATILGLTSGDGGNSVDGVAAETLTNAVFTLADMSRDWYGLSIAASATDDEIMSAAAFIEGDGTSRMLAVTTQAAGVRNSAITSDLASRLKLQNFKRTFCVYCSSNAYAAASVLGRMSTVNFNGSRTTLTLKFKDLPGVAAEKLTQTEWNTIKSKRCNVFALFETGTADLLDGVMSGPYWIDEIHGTDWLQNALQTDVYNLLHTAPKVPQTDEGTHSIITRCERTLGQAVTNGLLAPGKWTGPSFGDVEENQFLPKGFHVYAPLVATQLQADREARHSVPIQIAAKGAGAIHDCDIAISFNR